MINYSTPAGLSGSINADRGKWVTGFRRLHFPGLKMFGILLLLGAFLNKADAQVTAVTSYVYSSYLGSFTSIVGNAGASYVFKSDGTFNSNSALVGNVISNQDDANSGPIPLGFTFNFCNGNYTNIVYGTNGTMSLAPGATNSSYYNLASFPYTPGFSMVAADIGCYPSRGGSVWFQTTGAIGNRIFTIEVNKLNWGYSETNPAISYQVILYEATGRIQYIYKRENPVGYTPTFTSYPVYVGIASATGVYQSVTRFGTNPLPVSTTSSTTIADWPVTNQVLQWDPPPPCAKPTVQATALTLSSGASTVIGSFTLASTLPKGYMIVRTPGATPFSGCGSDGTIYPVGTLLNNGVVVYNGPTNSFTDGGLSSSTQYTYTVISYNEGTNCTRAYNCTNPLTASVTTGAVTTYTWKGPAGGNYSGDWRTAASWSPNRNVPDPSDILVFDNGPVPGPLSTTLADSIINFPGESDGKLVFTAGTTVVLKSIALSSRTLTIIGDNDSTTSELQIDNGSAFILNGSPALPLTFQKSSAGFKANVTIAGNLEQVNTSAANTFDFGNCNVAVTSTGTLASGGTLSTPSILNTTAANLIINGNFEYKYTSSSGPGIPLATWSQPSAVSPLGSTLKFSGFTSAPVAPVTGMTQTFYNVVYGCSNQTSNLVFLPSGGSFNALGQFTVLSTGTGSTAGSLIFGTNLPYVFNTGGFSQLSGAINFSSATVSYIPQVINVSGTFSQGGSGVSLQVSAATPRPNVTLNFNGNINTQNVTFSSSPLGPITYRVSNPYGIKLNAAGSLLTSPTFAINSGGGIRISVTNNTPVVTSLLLAYSQANSSLTYDTAGSCTLPATLMPQTNQPTNLYVNVGSGNFVNFNVPYNVTVADSLIFLSGDISIGINSLTIGNSPTRSGIIMGLGNVRMTTGSITRWLNPSQVPTGAAPPLTTASYPMPATAITPTGYFPITFGLANRNVFVYFSGTSALTAAGGTITVSHNPATSLSTVNIPDASLPATVIQSQTKASWNITPGNGLTLQSGYTIGLKITGAYHFNPINPANLRLMHASTVAGKHIPAAWVTPIVGAQRENLLISDLSTPFYIGGANSDMGSVLTAINTGNWTTAGTWDLNRVPTITDICVINPSVNVTVSSAACVAHSVGNNGTLTVNTAATSLTIDSSFINNGIVNVSNGVFNVNNIAGSGSNNGITNNSVFTISQAIGGTASVTVGPTGGGNRPFINNGTLGVIAGTLNVNGSLQIRNGSYFVQNGGSIVIDGNAGGNIAQSVPGGTPVLFIQSYLLSLTAGTINIVDPHVSDINNTPTFTYAVGVSGLSYSTSSNHTISFGNGVSSDPGGVNGFSCSLFGSNGIFLFGNLIINGATGTNRFVSSLYPNGVNGNMTINNGGEYRMGYTNGTVSAYSNLFLSGNLTVAAGGTMTSDSTLYFSNLSTNAVPGTVLTGRQVMSGTGTFRNSSVNPTGNLTNITVQNASGVAFNANNLSYTGKLGFVATNNTIPTRIIMQNGAILSEAYVTGVGSGSPVSYGLTSGWVAGTYQKHAEIGSLSMVFPIGDSVNNNYTPVTLFGTGTGIVTNSGDVQVKTTAGFEPLISTSALSPVLGVARYYSIKTANGITFRKFGVNATFSWMPTDIAPGTSASSLVVGLDSAGVWSYPKILGAPGFTTISIDTLAPKIAGNYQVAQGCPPTIMVSQPVTASGCVGTPVSFCDVVTGSGITHQWFHNKAVIPGATGSCYVITSPSINDTGNYYDIISGICAAPVISDTSVKLTIGRPPIISIQPLPQTVCAGTTLTLTTGFINGVRYTWQRNGVTLTNGPQVSGSVVSGQNGNTLTLSYAAAIDSGHYQVVDSSSCNYVYSNSVPVIIYKIPPANISFSGPVSFCGGTGVALTANTGINLKYKWMKNSIAAGQNDSAAIFPVNTTGSYQLIVTDANLCSDTSSATFVNANALPSPTVTAAGATTFCNGDTARLNSTTDPSYFYQWKLNGSDIPGATTPGYRASQDGVYQMIVTNAINCVGVSNKFPVHVISTDTPQVIASGPTTFCDLDSVNLTAVNGLGAHYQWIQDTTTLIGQVGSSYVATTSGNYRVKMTIGQCSATSLVTNITVYQNPSSVVTPPSHAPVCMGSTVTLNASNSSSYRYQWTNNTTPITGADSSALIIGQSGIYQVTVTDIHNCSSTSLPVAITVNPLPNPVISRSGANLNTTATYVSYQWNYNGSPVPSGGTTANYVATQNGFYSITVTDANGCSNTSTGVSITNVGVANVPVGLSDIRIYPNPASSMVHVDAPYVVNISVISLDGKELLNSKEAKNVDVSQLPNGLYVIKVSNQSGSMISIEKLVKSEQ